MSLSSIYQNIPCSATTCSSFCAPDIVYRTTQDGFDIIPISVQISIPVSHLRQLKKCRPSSHRPHSRAPTSFSSMTSYDPTAMSYSPDIDLSCDWTSYFPSPSETTSLRNQSIDSASQHYTHPQTLTCNLLQITSPLATNTPTSSAPLINRTLSTSFSPTPSRSGSSEGDELCQIARMKSIEVRR